MGDARDFTGRPKARNHLALGGESLCLFVDSYAAHRVVGGGNGLNHVVLALTHVHQAASVVEVLVVTFAGHRGDTFDGALKLF